MKPAEEVGEDGSRNECRRACFHLGVANRSVREQEMKLVTQTLMFGTNLILNEDPRQGRERN